jgi:hypothetical protein
MVRVLVLTRFDLRLASLTHLVNAGVSAHREVRPMLLDCSHWENGHQVFNVLKVFKVFGGHVLPKAVLKKAVPLYACAGGGGGTGLQTA